MKRPIHFLLLALLSGMLATYAQELTFNRVTSPTGFSNIVGGITQDKHGFIWLATGSGLCRYDGNRFKFINVDLATLNSPGGIRLETVYADRQGILWIGYWIGGLDRFDPESGKLTHFRHDPKDPSSISSDTVRSILQDKEGDLWVGTSSGLDKYDPKTNRFFNYHHDPDDPSSLSCNRIRKIYEDRQGVIWIGTGSPWNGEGGETDEGGLNKFDKKTGKFTRYIADPNNPKALINNKVQGLFEDSRGIFWVGHYPGGGVSSFNRANGTFRRFLGGRTIVSMVQDNSERIWVGTQGEGLYRGNSANNEFTKFTYPGSAIEYAFVNQITKDDQGNIWVNTASDIFRINTSLGLTTVFGSDYGVQRGTANYFGACKGSNGKIYYGKSDGFYSFLPEELIANPTPPQVVITDFQVTGESVISGKYGIIKGPFDEVKKVVLKHNQNSIAFGLTAIQFRNPENIRLLYMLEKYDNEWREGGVDRTAYYYALPSGHYTFRTKASNSEGKWTERNIEITVSPPWWRTWWAYSIYGLLLIVAGLATHRFMRQRVIAAERERSREREMAQAKEIEKAYKELGLKSKELEQQKEELQTTLEHLKGTQSQLIQSEKMASLGELTAGIAHEIQNPLNFVNNFSEVNVELLNELKDGPLRKLPEDVKKEADGIVDDLSQNLDKISFHGKRADSIVKGMLQHSRQSSGTKEPTDINALADEYLRLAYHGLRAKDNSFNATIKTDFDKSIGNINIIPQDIGRVLLNLYNNAFYAVVDKKKQHSESYEPTVSVTTKNANGKIEVRVKDNGNGIPQKVQDKIFQPFFTTKPTGEGTGLGLSLAYDIVKAHGGELKVETKEGAGSEFIIELPIP